jgi:hypothetical protein
MCTLLLKETIAYYTSNNTPVFCVFLNATKAFDKVNYAKLFDMLLARNLPAVVTKFLLRS